MEVREVAMGQNHVLAIGSDIFGKSEHRVIDYVGDLFSRLRSYLAQAGLEILE